MIIREILIFLAGLGFGIICRAVYVAVSKIERAVKLLPITIIFDIIMVGAGITAFTFMLFFLNDGVFMPYIFLASLIGFTAASLLF